MKYLNQLKTIAWVPKNETTCTTLPQPHYPGSNPLGRRTGPLMHPWLQKWACAKSRRWECINLCKPKRAISKSLAIYSRLFSHLQQLTAVTLNQCLWIVWLGEPPFRPQSNICLLLYILSILFTFRCLHPHHFYSFLPKVTFYFYYEILILFDDRHLTRCLCP